MNHLSTWLFTPLARNKITTPALSILTIFGVFLLILGWLHGNYELAMVIACLIAATSHTFNPDKVERSVTQSVWFYGMGGLIAVGNFMVFHYYGHTALTLTYFVITIILLLISLAIELQKN